MLLIYMVIFVHKSQYILTYIDNTKFWYFCMFAIECFIFFTRKL